MEKVMAVILFIGAPMALTLLLYRLIDHKGKKTALLTDKFPVLKEKKYLIQMLMPMIFIVLFGIISMVFHIPLKVFFIVVGVFMGFVNGMSVTIMYNE